MHARDSRRFKVKSLCWLFGVSKQAYYKHDANAVMADVAREEFVVRYIKSVRANDPGIGGVKLWHMYKREFSGGSPFGRDRFLDIIDSNNLKIRRKMRKPRTTDSSHGLPVFRNLTKDLLPERPNRLWVSDITYITLWDSAWSYRFCYLSLVLDAYTEEIIGWSLGPTLETCYPIEALKMALRRLGGHSANGTLIHHSDRGCQYASREYVALLKSNGILVSMTENGDPKENAQAERVNSTMKNELLKGLRFTGIGDARRAVGNAVEFYNTRRPHMSIGMMTPAEAAMCSGELDKKWTSFRQNAIKESLRETND